MSDNQQQNERGEWETAEPLPFLGTGIDWEVYGHRAIGFIGHEQVATVRARSRKMLTLKMFAAGLPYRKTPQDSATHSGPDAGATQKGDS